MGELKRSRLAEEVGATRDSCSTIPVGRNR
jgi:hypothetical protein